MLEEGYVLDLIKELKFSSIVAISSFDQPKKMLINTIKKNEQYLPLFCTFAFFLFGGTSSSRSDSKKKTNFRFVLNI